MSKRPLLRKKTCRKKHGRFFSIDFFYAITSISKRMIRTNLELRLIPKSDLSYLLRQLPPEIIQFSVILLLMRTWNETILRLVHNPLHEPNTKRDSCTFKFQSLYQAILINVAEFWHKLFHYLIFWLSCYLTSYFECLPVYTHNITHVDNDVYSTKL